jgi:hypothetical protein
VLEVGCGTGDTISKLKGKKKAGLDFSPAMIEVAKKRKDDYHNLNGNITVFSISGRNDSTDVFNELLEEDVDEDEDMFNYTHDVYINDTPPVSIPLNGISYFIRYPDPEVEDDWKDTNFTQDEANWLKEMRITPEALHGIYKGLPWKKDLAKNMATIVKSQCFNNSKMVLHSQCKDSREFIGKILKYWIENDKDLVQLRGENEDAKQPGIKSEEENPFETGLLKRIDINEVRTSPYINSEMNVYTDYVKISIEIFVKPNLIVQAVIASQ